ncbi:DUF1592 domain-containing protein [Verrucomicrobia bacterium]|nr:DUF1592 domain-containing protein [Verrucomicrobiota bacterium]MDC0218475.1 DUF1592 domain-containing protein [Verrucomicrobiota bacterium]
MTLRFVYVLCLLAICVQAADQPDLLRPFLKTYCTQCHGPEKQKGDRRFDKLTGDFTQLKEAETFQEILDQLNLAEMPPEGEKQPAPAEVRRVVEHLTKSLSQARVAARQNTGKVVLRRLNRVEYLNTVRDLFMLKMVDFDPTTTFPPDDPLDGFDNVGEGLVASDHLLQNYLEAARKVADKVVRPGPRPQMIKYQSGSKANADVDKVILNGVGIDKVARREAGRLYIKFRQPLGFPALDKKRGVPADGEYAIRFSAEAVRRKSRYKDSDLRYNSNEPMRLSISIDSRELGATAHRIIGEYEIPDDKVVEIEHRVWLEKGFTFHVHWANGPNGSFKRILRKVLPKYNKDALYPMRNPPEMYVGSGPELHIKTLEIEGPFYEEWPLPGFDRFFRHTPVVPNPLPAANTQYLRSCLTRLANAAFRRPVTAEEIKPYLDLAERYLEENGDFWAAARYGVRAILTSPRFLYLTESAPKQGVGKLDSYELASRLSYFLWSSMPDDSLREAAASGKLNTPKELRSQVERMLKDPRASALTENFVGQWLHLRKLGKMPPDPEKSRAYYADNLEEAMREETRRYFQYVLSNNRSILDFIDSDYTFLNPALARHYKIPGVTVEGFQKVSLKPEHHRGGLLGHGSILTATSNGVETQPVVRGVWILENLLGTPPNPPPPDIDPIEPDTRGVTAIRALMEKHRNNPTCFECHRKIDPLGLSMEHYDYIGVWRDRYNKKLPIDGSGKMPDGTAINGPTGIKQYLSNRPDQFTRCLTEKLFIYAMGRRISFIDRDDIDRIVVAMPRHKYGLRELIQQVVASEPFQSK